VTQSFKRSQRIIPYLSYRDAPAAIDFLCKAFGFEQRLRHPMPDGRIGHAELALAGDVVMLASSYEGFGSSPLDLEGITAQVFVWVDDVDAHFQAARAAGATIVAEPTTEHGHRSYRAMDPEGQRWRFAQRLEAQEEEDER
jgi:PhnB protein